MSYISKQILVSFFTVYDKFNFFGKTKRTRTCVGINLNIKYHANCEYRMSFLLVKWIINLGGKYGFLMESFK
jgi:hypothetical protein